MTKFDWFTILGMIAITENTICMIAQGGWLAINGLIFGGIWAWVAYWNWKGRCEEGSFPPASCLLPPASLVKSDQYSEEIQIDSDTNNLFVTGIDFEAIEAGYRNF